MYLKRQDSEDTRQKIRGISYTDWKKMGFSKGTLQYMKQNAKDEKPFTLNSHVRERLGTFSKHKCSLLKAKPIIHKNLLNLIDMGNKKKQNKDIGQSLALSSLKGIEIPALTLSESLSFSM